MHSTVRAIVPWFRAWLRTYSRYGHIHTARLDNELVGVGIRATPEANHLGGLRKLAFVSQIVGSVVWMGFTSRPALNMLRVGPAVEKREPQEPFWLLGSGCSDGSACSPNISGGESAQRWPMRPFA